MKRYKPLFTILFLFLFSASILAQSDMNSRWQEELESAQISNIASQTKSLVHFERGSGVLLIEDSTPASSDTIQQALINSSIAYTRVDNSVAVTMDITTWLTYDAVFFIGTTSTGAELDSCTAYLAAGGNLLVMDGDEAYFYGDTSGTGTSTPLFDQYIQASLVSDTGSDGVCVGEDLLTGESIDISADPWPDDVIFTGPDPVKILNAAISNNVAGSRTSGSTVDGLNYRVVLLCWDPEHADVASTTPIINKVYNYLANGIIPVELTSFTASVIDQDVVLNWTTASETNNSGFNVERKSANSTWETVAFVTGFGTTTETKSYSYVDSKLSSGTYTYRLKQIDFDGTSEYSNEVLADVTGPVEFALEQNYPNPFNPNTTISYSVAKAGFVNISVYNLLGEKVATLVNTTQEAGRYDVTFDASNIPSGIYFYSIEAGDFKSVKKMTLLK